MLATLALLVATLARVIPVALEPMEETDWLSSSSARSANTLREGALCRFSFMTRCFQASAVCELYMLYWRPLIAIEGLSCVRARRPPSSEEDLSLQVGETVGVGVL